MGNKIIFKNSFMGFNKENVLKYVNKQSQETELLTDSIKSKDALIAELESQVEALSGNLSDAAQQLEKTDLAASSNVKLCEELKTELQDKKQYIKERDDIFAKCVKALRQLNEDYTSSKNIITDKDAQIEAYKDELRRVIKQSENLEKEYRISENTIKEAKQLRSKIISGAEKEAQTIKLKANSDVESLLSEAMEQISAVMKDATSRADQILSGVLAEKGEIAAEVKKVKTYITELKQYLIKIINETGGNVNGTSPLVSSGKEESGPSNKGLNEIKTSLMSGSARQAKTPVKAEEDLLKDLMKKLDEYLEE